LPINVIDVVPHFAVRLCAALSEYAKIKIKAVVGVPPPTAVVVDVVKLNGVEKTPGQLVKVGVPRAMAMSAPTLFWSHVS
jgi:hypothetical protein